MRTSKKNRPLNFAVIGLGFISDRHIQSILNLGHNIIAVCDIDESKKHKAGNALFFNDYAKILKDDKLMKKLDYVAICTPNYLHYPMAKNFADRGIKVLVEKPMVINNNNLDNLIKRSEFINNVVQLRYNPEIRKLKKSIKKNQKYEASFAVGVHRDAWYFDSWKNNVTKSGGLLFNIGVHYFDLLVFLFGKPVSSKLEVEKKGYGKGTITFANCEATWELSVNEPIDNQYRYLRVNGEEINLTMNFENLHQLTYKEMIKGKGIKPEDIKDTLKLIFKLC